MHWWRTKFSSKKSRRSLPANTVLHSVPEDSLATPSKPHDVAVPRLGDLDSAEDSPKINAAHPSSFTQSGAQLSRHVLANSMFDGTSEVQLQEACVQQPERGVSMMPGVPTHRRGHSTGSLHHRQPSAGSVVDLGKAFDCILAAAPSKGANRQPAVSVLSQQS